MDLEDRLTVPSAEGIDLDLVLAGLGSRSVALLVDLLLQVVALWALALFAAAFGDAGVAVAAVGAFAVLLGYHVAFEAFNGGRTFGKAWLGIAVVSADGSPARFFQALVRNVVRFIDILPGTYLVGLVSVLATSRNQRVGDLAAGTVVIRRPRVRAAVPQVGWVPPAAGADHRATWDVSAVTADELAAVRSFLTRRGELAPEARAQLGLALAGQLVAKVAGVPLDGSPEQFLERIVEAKLLR